MGRLSRREFGLKYMCPFIAFLFTYFAIGSLYMTFLSEDDLVKSTGYVVSVQERVLRGKYTYYPLYITLNSYSSDYRLMDSYKRYFPAIESEVKPGDIVTIFHRNLPQTILGLGKTYDTYQISKGAKIIFPLSATKKHSETIMYMSLLFAAGLWIAYYFFYFRKRNTIKAAYNMGSAKNWLE